jgi:hypothetical protein
VTGFLPALSANGFIESGERSHRNYYVVDGRGVAYANAPQTRLGRIRVALKTRNNNNDV